MKNVFRLILLTLIVGLTLVPETNVRAQSDFYPITHLGVDHEFNERPVSTIGQDDLGFVWIGGTDGLNPLTGEVVHYRRQADDADPDSLSNITVTIQVFPPWWQTMWFVCIAVVLICVVILLAYRRETQRIRQQNRRLEDMVARRTAQLEEINRNLEAEILARLQVEEALSSSEARYRTIFNNSGTAMAISKQDFSLLLVNEEYERLTGYTRDELENGIKWTQFLHPEDADRVTGYNQQRWVNPKEAPRSYEFRLVSRDNQIHHILATAALIPGNRWVVVSLQDITQRIELESSLRLQNERYKRATQAAHAGVFEWDLQTGSLYIDPGIKAFLGYENEETPNNWEIWTNHIHPEDRQNTLVAAEAAKRGETPEFNLEYRMVTRNGAIHWVLSNGQVVRDTDGRPLTMIGTYRDITTRKQAEIQLNTSVERFRMVWEAASDAIALVDLEGFVLDANPAFLDLFNLSRDKVIWKYFSNFIPLQSLEKVRKDFKNILSNDPVLRFERQYSLQDGNSIIIDARINFINLDSQQPILLAIVRDISERKKAETALKQARDHLSTLLAVAQNLVSTLDLDQLLNLILDQLTMVIRYDAAAVFSLHKSQIEPIVYRGPKIPDELAYLSSHFAENPIFQHISQFKETYYINDTHEWEVLERQFGDGLDEWRNGLTLYQSWLALPLIVKGELIGGLVLAHAKPDHFDLESRALAKAFANHAAIAIENVQLYRQAKEAAVTTERMRLARDLHDSVTQALYAINLYSEASRLALAAGKIDVALQNIGELQSMDQEAVTDLRVLLFELRPPVLEEVGLVAAIKQLVKALEARANIQADFLAEGENKLPSEVETELFRVAQEALSNIAKHAQATYVFVRLRLEESRVHLVIRDNGKGFIIDSSEAGTGMGLPNLSERIKQLGGTMTIQTSPGRGTTLHIEFPYIKMDHESS